MQQQAFNKEHRMLKGGLHCHTTRSDGEGTPVEVITKHYQNGYDFLTLTDHDTYNLKNYTDLPITIVPGIEIGRDIADDRYIHCFHTVCIGNVEGNPFTQDEIFEGGSVKDQYEYQKVIDVMHGRNQLTIYCHPEWSGTPAEEFMHLKGNIAMEIWNSGCAVENNMDTNAAYWDQLLFDGQRIYGVATDDGHSMDMHCLGWVMVNAENNVPSILDALKNGRFYASTGPEIYDFRVENGVAKVECSPVSRVEFISWCMPSRTVRGENITTAEQEIPKEISYIRASVVDANGHRAWTNPIFLK
ncbi:MAG: CehA/McbA family metallohydrolase [Candidatus Faecivicinus sp.]|nr:CehA/McbA family metallohydrolase [Candidatus Faecivicinus sp.]